MNNTEARALPENLGSSLVARLAWIGLLVGVLLATASSGQTRDAVFVDQTVPTLMTAGGTHTVEVRFQNTGTETWDENFFAQAQNPLNNSNWGIARVYIPAGTTVATNEIMTFQFDVTAPATPGPWDFQWRMKKLGYAYFGELSDKLVIDVGEPCLDAEMASQDVPVSFEGGDIGTAMITMVNTGNQTWKGTTQTYQLSSMSPWGNTHWGFNRVDMDPVDVQPDEQVTFVMIRRAYVCQWDQRT